MRIFIFYGRKCIYLCYSNDTIIYNGYLRLCTCEMELSFLVLFITILLFLILNIVTLATHRADILDHEHVLWSWTLWSTCSWSEMFVRCDIVSTHLLIQKGHDCVQTNTGKCIGVSRNEYKLHDVTIQNRWSHQVFFITLVSMPTNNVTMLTGNVIKCYKKKALCKFCDRPPAKRRFHVKLTFITQTLKCSWIRFYNITNFN